MMFWIFQASSKSTGAADLVLRIKDLEAHLDEVGGWDDVGLGTIVCYRVNLGRGGEHGDRKKVLSVAIHPFFEFRFVG